MKGKELSGVYELRDNYKGNTYRAVYIAKLEDKIYVLHCFSKEIKERDCDTAKGYGAD